jgi:soluble lytic murein transglycosylase
VKSFAKLLRALCAALLPWAASALARPAALPAATRSVPAELQQLAARAANRRIWPRLRRYGETRKEPEQRGWAYFVLGYREYEAGDYPAAQGDLRQAALSGFPLADHAEFYRASAACRVQGPAQAAEVLEGFADRFPESPLRLQALELLAESLIQAHEAPRALTTLLAESRVRQHPSLALLLAQGYFEAGQVAEAARAFQEVYYAYPTAPQAKAAAEALATLRDRLSQDFPQPSEEIQTARAASLLKASQFEDAVKEYSALIESRPSSPFMWTWQLGKARCLLRLRRTSEALPILSQSFGGVPERDADRLALLVEIYAQESDATAMLQVLSLAQSLYPQSPPYASALFAAGNFYFRQQDWQNAARYYQPLTESFPQSEHAQDAVWRLALCYYYQKEPAKALQAFRDSVTRYPDSPHVAAALYWLGRLTEASGETLEAGALYALLCRRFVHSYYATRAARAEALTSHHTAEADAQEPPPGSLAAVLAQAIRPADMPSNRLCTPAFASKAVESAQILQALSLEDLAEEYLRAELSEQPAASELRYFLSRLEAGKGRVSAALLEATKVAHDYSQVEFEALPKDLWNLLFPGSYWKLVVRHARAHRLDPFLVMGLIRQESAFNPRATSSANARGLMQILPGTASRSRRPSNIRAVARRLYDPAYNVRFGCAYLRSLLSQFDGKWELALAAYHAGDLRVKDWLEKFPAEDPMEFLEAIPIPATRAYVEAVLRDGAIYKQLMTGSPKFLKCG